MGGCKWDAYSKKMLPPGRCEQERVLDFLKKVDRSFYKNLSSRVNLNDYSEKLASYAFNFFVSDNNTDIGHVAFYCNNSDRNIFITSIAVVEVVSGMGLGKKMLLEIERFASLNEIQAILLEADLESKLLKNFNLTAGFDLFEKNEKFLFRKKCQ